MTDNTNQTFEVPLSDLADIGIYPLLEQDKQSITFSYTRDASDQYIVKFPKEDAFNVIQKEEDLCADMLYFLARVTEKVLNEAGLTRRDTSKKVEIDEEDDHELYWSEPIEPNIKVETSSMGSKALKYDENKVDWSLIPVEAMEEVLKVFQYGERKYARWNFRNGFNSNRLIASCLRHVTSWQKGIDLDEETGLSHLSHAVCCLLMLRTNQIDNVMEDGRYKKKIAN